MATITYNGVSAPNKMMTFTDIPNILKLSDSDSGTKAEITLEFIGSMVQVTSADSQYYISCLGDTITNVINPQNNNNKRFYGSQYPASTAMNVVRALRCCGRVSAEFDVLLYDNTTVMLRAKNIGSQWAIATDVFSTNIPNSRVIINFMDGNSGSVYHNSKINVDICDSPSYDADHYITTLEKNFYGEECSFNMSPILETISKYGETVPYSFKIRTIKEDGQVVDNGSVSGVTSFGYHANESDDYLTADTAFYLGNTTLGNGSAMTLYTYSNVIDYSVLGGSGGWIQTVKVKNSIGDTLYTDTTNGHHPYGYNYIHDKTYEIPQQYMQRGNYIELTIGAYTTRFNIISPLKATEYFQRILWRNEYGGISFFDFTGGRSESDSVDTETYEKNVFDYYDTNEYEKKKMYSVEYDKTVTLKSHLMDENGKNIFNSLMRSKKVWTVIDNKKYYIIPKSISVEEDGTYNGIYVAKFTYEYSDM